MKNDDKQSTTTKPKSTDLLEAPVSQTLWQHSLSNVSGNIIMVSRNLIDGFYAAQISTLAIATLTLTMPLFFLIMGLSLSLSIVSGNLIARAKGATKALPKTLITHVLISTVLMSLVIAAGLALLTPTIIHWFGSKGVITPMAIELSYWLVAGVPLLFGYGATTAIIRALGEPQRAIKATVIGLLTGAVITPVLIYTPWLNTEHKLIAIAIGLNISYLVTTLLLLLRLQQLAVFSDALCWTSLVDNSKTIYRQAIPVLMTNLLILSAIFIITWIAAQSSTEALAAFGVVSRFEQFSLICINGIVLSLTPFVGQNLGAGQLDRVSTGILYGLKLIFAIALVIGITIVVLAPQIVQLFNLTGAGRDYALWWLYLAAAGLFFQGVMLMGTSLLQVFSREKLAMLLTGVRIYLIMLPLLYFIGQMGEIRYLYVGISFSYIFIGSLFIAAILILIRRQQTSKPQCSKINNHGS